MNPALALPFTRVRFSLIKLFITPFYLECIPRYYRKAVWRICSALASQ